MSAFKQFLKEEFDWIYCENDEEMVNMLLDQLDASIESNDITEEEWEFIRKNVIRKMDSDEWLINQIHDRFNDFLYEELKKLISIK